VGEVGGVFVVGFEFLESQFAHQFTTQNDFNADFLRISGVWVGWCFRVCLRIFQKSAR